MIVAIRNRSGFDVFLAISAGEHELRIKVTLTEPKGAFDHVEKVRHGYGFGIPACPEGLGVKVRCPPGMLYAAKRREVIDRLDEDGERDGQETYLEFVIRLLN